MMLDKTRYLVLTAIVAALYFALTLISYPIAYGPIQLRLSESLMLAIPLIPAAIPGVTLGVFLANFFNPGNLGPVDYIGGTLATLLAALWTRRLHARFVGGYEGQEKLWHNPSLYLLPLPSVLVNGAIVGVYLPFLITAPELPTASFVITCIVTFSISEAIVVYFLGLPFYLSVRRIPFMRQMNTGWSELQ